MTEGVKRRGTEDAEQRINVLVLCSNNASHLRALCVSAFQASDVVREYLRKRVILL